ncbi:hypothetical protein ACA910_014373 [Epithemia clementina (nom. ined.)]
MPISITVQTNRKSHVSMFPHERQYQHDPPHPQPAHDNITSPQQGVAPQHQSTASSLLHVPPASPPSATIATEVVVEIREKPKRPLSAYNLFFQNERQNLLANRPVRPEGVPHRRGHGKMGFAEMAKAIAAKWKEIDADTKTKFEGLARQEKLHYKKKVAEWRQLVRKRPPLNTTSESNKSNKKSKKQPHRNSLPALSSRAPVEAEVSRRCSIPTTTRCSFEEENNNSYRMMQEQQQQEQQQQQQEYNHHQQDEQFVVPDQNRNFITANEPSQGRQQMLSYNGSMGPALNVASPARSFSPCRRAVSVEDDTSILNTRTTTVASSSALSTANPQSSFYSEAAAAAGDENYQNHRYHHCAQEGHASHQPYSPSQTTSSCSSSINSSNDYLPLSAFPEGSLARMMLRTAAPPSFASTTSILGALGMAARAEGGGGGQFLAPAHAMMLTVGIDQLAEQIGDESLDFFVSLFRPENNRHQHTHDHCDKDESNNGDERAKATRKAKHRRRNNKQDEQQQQQQQQRLSSSSR